MSRLQVHDGRVLPRLRAAMDFLGGRGRERVQPSLGRSNLDRQIDAKFVKSGGAEEGVPDLGDVTRAPREGIRTAWGEWIGVDLLGAGVAEVVLCGERDGELSGSAVGRMEATRIVKPATYTEIVK